MTQRNIIAVGASSGGVAALRTLLSELAPSLPAAVLVVQHTGPHESILPALLQRSGGLPVQHAAHGEPVVPGRVYVAPPDHHLLVTGRSVLLTRGPKENHTRPAIDPLFRSVAVHHGAAAIGVVLTGHLDDGTAGLLAIKACGGVAVVQDPQEAEAPSMPDNALHHVEVDHVLPVARMGALLTELVRQPAAAPTPAPGPALTDELRLSASEGRALDALGRIGQPSVFSCPECHGVLWQIETPPPLRFRCHTGHSYSAHSLGAAHSGAAEEALWSAMRALREKAMLLQRLAATDQASGKDWSAAMLSRSAAAAERQVDLLQRMLSSGDAPGAAGTPAAGQPDEDASGS